MPITLSAIVRQHGLGLTVLAAPDALDSEVTWVHASELVDPTACLTGGELLLSVGLWLGRGRSGGSQPTAYVDRLVRAGVVGLGQRPQRDSPRTTRWTLPDQCRASRPSSRVCGMVSQVPPPRR